MNAKQKIHQAKLTEWAALFQEKESSGLTVKAWCNQNNISIHTYNYWKHLLKEQYVDSLLPDIVPISHTPSSQSLLSSKAQCNLLSTRSSCESNDSRELLDSSPIRISINNITIEIAASVSDERITRILKAVRYA